jgi:hypothetical protein
MLISVFEIKLDVFGNIFKDILLLRHQMITNKGRQGNLERVIQSLFLTVHKDYIQRSSHLLPEDCQLFWSFKCIKKSIQSTNQVLVRRATCQVPHQPYSNLKSKMPIEVLGNDVAEVVSEDVDLVHRVPLKVGLLELRRHVLAQLLEERREKLESFVHTHSTHVEFLDGLCWEGEKL